MTTEEKPWQQGIPIRRLRSVTNVFKAYAKPYAHGPFDAPNDAAIAEAMSKKLCFGGSKNGKWVVIQHPRKRLMFSLFNGFELKFTSECHIDNVAYAPSALGDVIEWLQTNATSVVIFEEDKALRRALQQHGFWYQGTHITAASTLRALYAKNETISMFRPLETIQEEDYQTLCTLNPNFLSKNDHQAIILELHNYPEIEWSQHYSTYNKRHSWTAFALRGYKPNDPTFIIKPQEMSRSWKAGNSDLLRNRAVDTSAMVYFPNTLEIIKRLNCEFDRVRFMRLTPKGELTRHSDITDRSAGVSDGLVSRLHIPILTNPFVEFNALDARGRLHTMKFKERGLYYLDQRKPHFVSNGDTSRERIHLVVDCITTPELRALIQQGVDGQ